MPDALDEIALDDLYLYGLPQAVVDQPADGVPQACLLAAIAYARSNLEMVRNPVFSSVGPLVTEKTCHIAAYQILCRRGFRPGSNNYDENYVKRHDDAVRWFERVAAGKAIPDVVELVDPGETPEHVGGVVVRSSPLRGWGSMDFV